MKGFAELDTRDPALCADYERAFYDAFAPVTTNRLIRRLWHWDDAARRLSTRISYEDQAVYVLRDGRERIRVGLAVNCTLAEFQSRAFGFAPPETGRDAFEFLAFFAPAPRPPRSLHLFGMEALDRLKARGFRIGFATTAPPLLPFYLRLGFRVLDEREISGERRSFMSLPLAAVDLRRIDSPPESSSIRVARSGMAPGPETTPGSERPL